MGPSELQHYGVLGMKWGVRRTPAQLARARGSTKKKDSDDDSKTATAKKTTSKGSSKQATKTENQPKKKSISDMSDDELKTMINRLDLENRYRTALSSSLPKKEASASDKTKKIVEEIITNSVKNIGTQTVTYMMGTGVNKLLSQVFNDAQVVNPKKGQKDK